MFNGQFNYQKSRDIAARQHLHSNTKAYFPVQKTVLAKLYSHKAPFPSFARTRNPPNCSSFCLTRWRFDRIETGVWTEDCGHVRLSVCQPIAEGLTTVNGAYCNVLMKFGVDLWWSNFNDFCLLFLLILCCIFCVMEWDFRSKLIGAVSFDTVYNGFVMIIDLLLGYKKIENNILILNWFICHPKDLVSFSLLVRNSHVTPSLSLPVVLRRFLRDNLFLFRFFYLFVHITYFCVSLLGFVIFLWACPVCSPLTMIYDISSYLGC